MKVDGREIADKIYGNLRIRVGKLKKQGIVPHIAVILIGEDPASKSYILQKKKNASDIGALFSLIHYPSNVTEEEVLKSISHLNEDDTVHGIIVQRPFPPHINKHKIVDVIHSEKDIDGFRPDSTYDVPVAQAVFRVLQDIYQTLNTETIFQEWLEKKSITVIGKGETAGGPIISHLKKNNLNPTIVSSQTENPEEIINQADIVISAVGKSEVIKPEYLKDGVIVLGVGLFKGEDEKLHGDYIAENIQKKASFYTPVIGGIGPINVAYLLTNLVMAAETN